MQNMVSMKRSKKKREDIEKEISVAAEVEEEYPWGLRLNLNTEELQKLGITADMDISEEVVVVAKAKVIELRKSTSQGTLMSEKKTDMSMELQITDMQIGESSPNGADLYDD